MYLFLFLNEFERLVVPLIVFGEVFKPLEVRRNLLGDGLDISDREATLLLLSQIIAAHVVDADRRESEIGDDRTVL